MANPKMVLDLSVVRVRLYPVIARAVAEGVGWGISRAHKHTDKPSRDVLAENIEREVMNALSEILDYGDVP